MFITGAGSGIGRAGAELFLDKGWRVGAVDRDAVALTTICSTGRPGRLWTQEVDVTDRDGLGAALAAFAADNPNSGLNMMWNNAGIGQLGWFEDVPYDQAMRVVDVNLTAVLTGAFEALPF